MNNRHLHILEILSEQKKIEVTTLAQLCDVSQVTIRKDLIELETKGLLKREHGYAVVNNEDDINYRLSFDYKQKEIIVKKAVEHIFNGETIIIESGSTCTLLALEIAKTKKNVTIITNSVFIARYIKDYPSTTVILLGGKYQGKSETLVGVGIKESLSLYHVDKLFIGIDGIDNEIGFSGSDLERCQVVRFMKQHSNKVYVLTDIKKFNHKSHYRSLGFDEIDYVITDEPANKLVNKYSKLGFQII